MFGFKIHQEESDKCFLLAGDILFLHGGETLAFKVMTAQFYQMKK